MTTATTQRLTPAQRAMAAEALQYPELPEVASNRLLLLCAWLRALAEFEAFQAFASGAACRSARQQSARLGMAISGACLALEEDLDDITDDLLAAGGILFAWSGTTALEGGAA